MFETGMGQGARHTPYPGSVLDHDSVPPGLAATDASAGSPAASGEVPGLAVDARRPGTVDRGDQGNRRNAERPAGDKVKLITVTRAYCTGGKLRSRE